MELGSRYHVFLVLCDCRSISDFESQRAESVVLLVFAVRSRIIVESF